MHSLAASRNAARSAFEPSRTKRYFRSLFSRRLARSSSNPLTTAWSSLAPLECPRGTSCPLHPRPRLPKSGARRRSPRPRKGPVSPTHPDSTRIAVSAIPHLLRWPVHPRSIAYPSPSWPCLVARSGTVVRTRRTAKSSASGLWLLVSAHAS